MRPYLAIFAAQFQLTLQYRAAALAGFVTQCWWGGLKIMVLSAFFAAGAARASITLEQLVSYIWLGQGLLALQPWSGDPAVGAGVRTGSLSLERLRPLDGYAYWYARSAATMTSRALSAPRPWLRLRLRLRLRRAALRMPHWL